MTVRLKTQYAGPNGCYPPGAVVKLGDEEKALIAGGYAVAMEERPPPAVASTLRSATEDGSAKAGAKAKAKSKADENPPSPPPVASEGETATAEPAEHAVVKKPRKRTRGKYRQAPRRSPQGEGGQAT